jgi:hypothetical protein
VITAAGPNAPLPQQLSAWVDESACHAELTAANLQALAGAPVLDALAGDRLEQLERPRSAVRNRRRRPDLLALSPARH